MRILQKVVWTFHPPVLGSTTYVSPVLMAIGLSGSFPN